VIAAHGADQRAVVCGPSQARTGRRDQDGDAAVNAAVANDRSVSHTAKRCHRQRDAMGRTTAGHRRAMRCRSFAVLGCLRPTAAICASGVSAPIRLGATRSRPPTVDRRPRERDHGTHLDGPPIPRGASTASTADVPSVTPRRGDFLAGEEHEQRIRTARWAIGIAVSVPPSQHRDIFGDTVQQGRQGRAGACLRRASK